MKKFILLCLLLLMACAPKPNDLPPSLTSTPKSVPNVNMSEAGTFLTNLKTTAAAGDGATIATRVHYPIKVKVNGQITTINNSDEFVKNYALIFNETIINALTKADEANLTNLPDGIRVSNGELWFGLFCVDATCAEPVFLITQINN